MAEVTDTRPASLRSAANYARSERHSGNGAQAASAARACNRAGLPVPPWSVASTPGEASELTSSYLETGVGAVVIKAQVLVGGRGKAGGVKLAKSRDEARAVADAILGMDIKGITVRRVLIAPGADIVRELYLAAVLDRANQRIMLMGSAEGGVEIEKLAEEDPDAILTIHAHPHLGRAVQRLRLPLGWPSQHRSPLL